MEKSTVIIKGIEVEVYSANTLVVGSGAAAFNAADSLYLLGQKDVAVVTEGIHCGTSRNTGSDKQTYYKLTLSGGQPDSVLEMAKTLFDGGAMHGDIALIEAALSAKSFYKLAEIGVPFPHNKYGEYIGYKTDHDPGQRATSAGPLTSRFMTEKLEQQVKSKGIKIFDGYQVIGILTDRRDGNEIHAVGMIALNLNGLNRENYGITLFNCTNIVYGTGGPAGMYLTSVYPESQTGATGIAFEAGVKGVNLTESQYGIASVKFRWNLSGTYQQVLPRYISTNMDGGDEREFLADYFESPGKMLDAVFLKGYQWPFDVRKISGGGSSLIDILVYNETQNKGRRVFLDFSQNPSAGSNNGELDFSLLGEESRTYLKNSGALFGKPIDRLKKMNLPAVELYRANGIDLTCELLEIAVCAQHNNGGLIGNLWWESNVRHFFPVGEVNGSFGVYRPGGSALNSTQVGSSRAAQYITAHYTADPMHLSVFAETVSEQVAEKLLMAQEFTKNSGKPSKVIEIRRELQTRMTKAGAHIRSLEGCNAAIEKCAEDFETLGAKTKTTTVFDLPEAFTNRDLLIAQYVYLCAIREYIQHGGRSRGSYLIKDEKGMLPVQNIPEEFRFLPDDGRCHGEVCEIELQYNGGKLNLNCLTHWKPVRPIPEGEHWFESVWQKYLNHEIVEKT